MKFLLSAILELHSQINPSQQRRIYDFRFRTPLIAYWVRDALNFLIQLQRLSQSCSIEHKTSTVALPLSHKKEKCCARTHTDRFVYYVLEDHL